MHTPAPIPLFLSPSSQLFCLETSAITKKEKFNEYAASAIRSDQNFKWLLRGLNYEGKYF
jgi:hypothetical protein